jgi:hypothetical protein
MLLCVYYLVLLYLIYNVGDFVSITHLDVGELLSKAKEKLFRVDRDCVHRSFEMLLSKLRVVRSIRNEKSFGTPLNNAKCPV